MMNSAKRKKNQKSKEKSISSSAEMDCLCLWRLCVYGEFICIVISDGVQKHNTGTPSPGSCRFNSKSIRLLVSGPWPQALALAHCWLWQVKAPVGQRQGCQDSLGWLGPCMFNGVFPSSLTSGFSVIWMGERAVCIGLSLSLSVSLFSFSKCGFCGQRIQ